LTPEKRGQFVALKGLGAAPRDVAQQDELFATADEQWARGPGQSQLTQRRQRERGGGHWHQRVNGRLTRRLTADSAHCRIIALRTCSRVSTVATIKEDYNV